MKRGCVVYTTTAHVARCADCAWQSTPRTGGPRTTKHKPEHIGNIAAARHARVHRHRVVVEIQREFDRRAPATLADLDDVMPVDEPLCDRCNASFRAPKDTLCAACRYEIDELYHDLPGAPAAT